MKYFRVVLFLFVCAFVFERVETTIAQDKQVLEKDAAKSEPTKSVSVKENSTGAVATSQPNLIPKELLEQFKIKWPKNKIINVVFHGHSVPAGYYVTPEVRPFDSYPHLVYKGLKERYPVLQMNCIVTAIGGETSPKGAARFEKDVLTHNPDLIFIDYTLNDRRVKEDDVRQAWSSMIEMAQKKKIPVVLITPTGAINAKYDDPEEPLNVRASIVRELAAKYQCPLADVLRKWKEKIDGGVEPKSLLSNEMNHPNLVGHQLAADVVLELFKGSDK